MAWTHPSVRQLLEDSGGTDPFEEIVRRARKAALDAMEEGWKGPPYDPFGLAQRMGIAAVPREDLEDARLVSGAEGRPRIEFNPVRRIDRVRFSVAHELGHVLFADHGDRTRYRNESHRNHERADSWQLEVLCNVAAAEFLMPAGAFPLSEADDLRLAHLLDLRATFGVSTEALLRRALRLTERPAAMFACARLSDGRFRLDYVVSSRAWRPPLQSGQVLSSESVLSHCTAVGFSVDADEAWPQVDGDLHVQAVGIPPYPGDTFPRVVGLVQPPDLDARRVAGIRMVRGDATRPHVDGPTIIAHIVNDKARTWGGHGFAPALGRRLPDARRNYVAWAAIPGNLKLGAVHLDQASNGLWVASLVAQGGYGETTSGRPRLRLPALAECLRQLARQAKELDASVHMPPIGTGQAATPWPRIRDLVSESLLDAGVRVTVYVLEGEPMPEDVAMERQLSLT